MTRYALWLWMYSLLTLSLVENIREVASGKPVKVYNLSDKLYDYSHYNMVVVEYPLNPYLYQEILACILDLHEWTQRGNYVVLHDSGLLDSSIDVDLLTARRQCFTAFYLLRIHALFQNVFKLL